MVLLSGSVTEHPVLRIWPLVSQCPSYSPPSNRSLRAGTRFCFCISVQTGRRTVWRSISERQRQRETAELLLPPPGSPGSPRTGRTQEHLPEEKGFLGSRSPPRGRILSKQTLDLGETHLLRATNMQAFLPLSLGSPGRAESRRHLPAFLPLVRLEGPRAGPQVGHLVSAGGRGGTLDRWASCLVPGPHVRTTGYGRSQRVPRLQAQNDSPQFSSRWAKQKQ